MNTVEVQRVCCRVSVIMLTMDRPQYIEAAIASVRSQTMVDWELIIVHDGLDRRTAAAVAPWLKADARIRYFHRAEPGNIANALNYALARACGEFIAILDDDDVWMHDEKLALQVAVLVAEADVVCVGGGAIVVDAQGRETMRYLKPAENAECRRRGLVANPLIHSTALYRRSAAMACGAYDDSLRAYADWDFCLKLMQVGRFVNLREYFMTYRIWNGGSSSRYGMSIAWSGFQIVNRHRRHYPDYPSALALSLAHLLFALLPQGLRVGLYQVMSRWKKKIFSAPA